MDITCPSKTSSKFIDTEVTYFAARNVFRRSQAKKENVFNIESVKWRRNHFGPNIMVEPPSFQKYSVELNRFPTSSRGENRYTLEITTYRPSHPIKSSNSPKTKLICSKNMARLSCPCFVHRTLLHHILLGGFNLIENISQIESFPPSRAENQKCSKPPPSIARSKQIQN